MHERHSSAAITLAIAIQNNYVVVNKGYLPHEGAKITATSTSEKCPVVQAIHILVGLSERKVFQY